VVDITHENAIEQNQTVNDVLEELGAADKPRVTALNKIDLLTDPSLIDTSIYPNAICVSAAQRINLDGLMNKIAEVIISGMVRVRVMLPYDRGDLVELFHRRGQVNRQDAQSEGTLVTGLLPRTFVGVFAPFRAAPENSGRRRAVRPAADPTAAPTTSAESEANVQPVGADADEG
jgi:GTP-binding protein HflX